jgi:hypothetical protein
VVRRRDHIRRVAGVQPRRARRRRADVGRQPRRIALGQRRARRAQAHHALDLAARRLGHQPQHRRRVRRQVLAAQRAQHLGRGRRIRGGERLGRAPTRRDRRLQLGAQRRRCRRRHRRGRRGVPLVGLARRAQRTDRALHVVVRGQAARRIARAVGRLAGGSGRALRLQQRARPLAGAQRRQLVRRPHPARRLVHHLGLAAGHRRRHGAPERRRVAQPAQVQRLGALRIVGLPHRPGVQRARDLGRDLDVARRPVPVERARPVISAQPTLLIHRQMQRSAHHGCSTPDTVRGGAVSLHRAVMHPRPRSQTAGAIDVCKI